LLHLQKSLFRFRKWQHNLCGGGRSVGYRAHSVWDQGVRGSSLGKVLNNSVFFLWGWTYVTRYCGHFWPIVQPQMIDEGDCGAIGGMKIGRGNRSTRRKPAPAPFCPPQIPLDQTRARTRAAAVGSQRLTAWAITSALVGGEWSASRPRRFNPRERDPGSRRIGDWMGPRASLDDVEKRKFLTVPGFELRPLGRPARSQLLYRLRYPGPSIRVKIGFQS
jgi:hypothetical protein